MRRRQGLGRGVPRAIYSSQLLPDRAINGQGWISELFAEDRLSAIAEVAFLQMYST